VGNGTLPALRAIRNPLPSWGGIDPEAIEHVKLLAPAAFRAEQFRAVTEADYALAAERQPEVLSAVADFSWSGSWHTVFIAVLPRATAELTPELRSRVLAWVSGYTQAGYDLEILPPLFVPLDLTVEVCVAPDHFRGDVERALAEALGTGLYVGSRPAFFNHQNWVFGKALYVSDLYAAIQSVEGVTSARITGLKRLDGLDADVPERTGYLPIGRHEVVRLDNDPNFPENGVLELTMQGGK
jgi:predicted phage baseplate assembly protein